MILAILTAGALLGPPPQVERTPNLYRVPSAACRDIARQVSNDQREAFRRLGTLPNGSKQYAVMRQVGGCPVPTPMGYHPPALPGAADAPASRTQSPDVASEPH